MLPYHVTISLSVVYKYSLQPSPLYFTFLVKSSCATPEVRKPPAALGVLLPPEPIQRSFVSERPQHPRASALSQGRAPYFLHLWGSISWHSDSNWAREWGKWGMLRAENQVTVDETLMTRGDYRHGQHHIALWIYPTYQIQCCWNILLIFKYTPKLTH
jgi:hypothetical protein